ncbi:MAG: FtsX-like permease family protein [Ruminococcus sp.]|nr:FtsX-like permease family protein [Ruminococcus sp.]
MKKKLILNTLRSVKNTKSRFFAIMAIIAIGCGFFAGVKSAGPDMKLSAADYFEKQGLADIHMMSALGFDDEDVTAVSDTGIADEIYAGYSADLIIEGGDNNGKIVKTYSYNKDSGINLPYLTEGRLPEKADEIVVDEKFYSAVTPNIGDKITLTADGDNDISDYLSRAEFTVVGKARLPVYVAYDRGSAGFGNGVINGWLLIPEENFSYDIYTDIYVRLSETADVDPFTNKYEEIIDSSIDRLEELGEVQIEHRKNVVLEEAYEEIDDAKAEVADGEAEIAENEQKLADAEKEIADGEAEISENLQKIADAEKEIADGQEELTDREIEYHDGERFINIMNGTVNWINGIIDDYAVNAAANETEISEKIESYPSNDFFAVDETLQQLITGYMSIPAAYDDGTKSACGQGLRQYSAELSAQAQELETTLAESRIQLDNAKAELDNARAEVAEGKEEIEKARTEIADGKQEIADGKKEIADAKKEIEEAKEEIADAEREAHEAVDDAEWYVFDRDFNPYYSHYAEDCERVDAIAAVFPIFFILVAALVCCTTMTRMVEEQRTQIGTLKALGYSRFTIISQYILYALAASIPGGFVGLLIGFNTLPRVIFVCYQSMYTQPYLIANFKWDYAIGCITAACLCTGLSALYASRQELVSCPAQLMRPKPPKDGKRILLERITFIWKRLKFTTKVTFRNLFRYKARLLMTVIGIAGCTALLLTGFGLKESISAIVDRQYGDIFRYDALAALDEDSGAEFSEIISDCESSGIVTEKMLVMQGTEDVWSDLSNGEKFEAYIMVPSEAENFRSFIDLHTRQGKSPIELGDGVVLGEKLARFLGVKVGDEVYFAENKPIRVDGICENYTFNYAYMKPETYAKTGLGELKNNILLMNMTDENASDQLSEVLLEHEAVLGISYSSGGGDKFRDLVDSLALIVVAIIASAGALAFVVLFNLSNINVNERIRELATIKVLGFFDGEVAAYIYRENILSTIMGTGAGLILGIFLEKFVVQTAEVDAVMFAPGIAAYCFFAAAAISVFFSVLVNITLYFRLKKIDMATSLKAIE